MGTESEWAALFRHEVKKNCTHTSSNTPRGMIRISFQVQNRKRPSKGLRHIFSLPLLSFCSVIYLNIHGKNVGSKEGNQIKLRSSKKRIPARTPICVCA